jgi:hypothetical protein
MSIRTAWLGAGLPRLELIVASGEPHIILRDRLRTVVREVVPGSAASWWSL